MWELEAPPKQGAQPWLVHVHGAMGISAGGEFGLIVNKRQIRAETRGKAGFGAAIKETI